MACERAALPQVDDARIAVIGLGYVGLPLALAFAKYWPAVGFDCNAARITALLAGQDDTGEVNATELCGQSNLHLTSAPAELAQCNVYVVTVPTPIDQYKQPDLAPLRNASQTLGLWLKRGDVVIYESTVFPGATEEVCVPLLEQASGLAFNQDFYCGYSPERINPGDKQRRVADIVKVTSGSTPEVADFVDGLYARIITAGTHKAPSIKVAEAAKVIENTQRDANIALMNEFALIFHRMGIDTQEVLAAAVTKWNFLPFQPGMVGGHCIGVDPYYLIQQAQALGYYPDILLACRRINDAMGRHVASEVIKLMIGEGVVVKNARVLVLGLSFKENCADLRNTRVVELVQELASFGVAVDVHDPWADRNQALQEYGLELLETLPEPNPYAAVLVAVGHEQFKAPALREWAAASAVIYDIKSIWPKASVSGRL